MKRVMGCAVAVLVLLSSASALAQQVKPWKFEVTPYLWYAGLEGDITLNGTKTDFDKSAGDLFKAVDVGGSFLATAQYQKFIFWGQLDYFSLDTDQLDVEDQPQGGELGTKLTLAELGIGYQLTGFSKGQTFDVLVGVRTLNMENDLTVDGMGTVSTENNLADPIVVVRPTLPLFPSKFKGALLLNPTFAIGGGGDSDLVYELFPQLKFHFSRMFSARLGYRTVGYKFEEDNGNELNIRLAGLIVGFGANF